MIEDKQTVLVDKMPYLQAPTHLVSVLDTSRQKMTGAVLNGRRTLTALKLRPVNRAVKKPGM